MWETFLTQVEIKWGDFWCYSTCLSVFFYLFFLWFSFSLKEERLKFRLQSKHRSSWVQFVHGSTEQSHQRPPAVGLLGSLEALPSRQSLESTDKALSGWVIVFDVSVGDHAQRWGTWHEWAHFVWRMKGCVVRGRCDKTAEQSVAGTGVGSQDWCDVPTQMRSEIPTCTVLTMACALKGHRADQNYCCSKVLTSSLGSLCWASHLGKLKYLENRL